MDEQQAESPGEGTIGGLPHNVQKEVLQQGFGVTPELGSRVEGDCPLLNSHLADDLSVHVKGWVQTAPDKVITSTRDESTGPVRVTVGAGISLCRADVKSGLDPGEVLEGVDEALAAMQVSRQSYPVPG